MAGCVNLERNEDGEYEDSILREVVREEDIFSVMRGNIKFCYSLSYL